MVEEQKYKTAGKRPLVEIDKVDARILKGARAAEAKPYADFLMKKVMIGRVVSEDEFKNTICVNKGEIDKEATKAYNAGGLKKVEWHVYKLGKKFVAIKDETLRDYATRHPRI